MDFRVLGAVEVVDGERPVVLGGGKPRALLAALLLRHGRPVPVPALVDDLWGDRPPSSAEKLVQLNVSKLRAAIGPCVRTANRAYLLEVAPADLDVARFRGLADRSAGTPDPAEALRLCGAALAEWRGSPATDVELLGPSRDVVIELEAMHWSLMERRIDLEMQLDGAARVVPELERLVSAEPLREHVRAQLMRALAAGGRRAEALAVFRSGRDLLVGELGVEPGEELQQVHDQLLQDPPVQLRTTRRDLTGRQEGSPPATPGAPGETVVPRVGRRPRWARPAVVAPALAVLAVLAVLTLPLLGPAPQPGRDRPAVGRARPTTVPEMDPRTRVVVGHVPLLGSVAVGQGAGPLAVASRFAWVRNGLDETVSQVDLRHREVAHITRVGAGAGGITTAAGDVWVTNTLDGSVSRLDGTTGEPVATIPIGRFPQGIAAAGGFVWVASSRSAPAGWLWRIDPASNLVVGRTKVADRATAGPSWLAAAGDDVWAAVPDLGVVVRVDARSGRRTAVVPVPAHAVCGGLSADDHAVWIASGTCGDGGLTRIDPRSARIVARVVPPFWNWSLSVATGQGDVWVMADTGLYRVDQATNQVTSMVSAGTGTLFSGDVATAGGSVWVHDARTGSLVRLGVAT